MSEKIKHLYIHCINPEISKQILKKLSMFERVYINGGTIHVQIEEKELGMINTYDLTVGINDKHNKAKSILNKWDVKLKSKLNNKFGYHNNFDIEVIANSKDPECIGCIHALRLMSQTPCSECKKSQHLYFTKENPMEWPALINCYNCKHRHKLVTEEPCRTCLSPDNDCNCWKFSYCPSPCSECNTVKSSIVCNECESHHWKYYEAKEE